MRGSERTARPALIAAYWFGIQFVWGAVLAVSLQARVTELVPFASVAAYGRLAAIGAFVAMVTQLGVGPLSDRLRAQGFDRRAFYAAGLVVAIPALWLFYGASTYTGLTLAFYALQIGMNVAIGPYQAVIPDYIAPAASGRAAAWMGAFQSLGNACGSLVAGFVADARIVGFALAAVLAVTYFLTAWHVSRVRPRPVTAAPEIRIDAAFRTLLASRGCINLGFYTLLGFLFFFVRESVGIADARRTTASCFIAFTLCAMAGAALGGRPADRFDKRLVISIANVVVAIALLIAAAVPRLDVLYGASAAAGAALGAFLTADWALACTLLPATAMASSMAIWNTATTFPQVIAPLVTTQLVRSFDARSFGLGPRVAIVLAVVELTFGAVWLWRLPSGAAGGGGGESVPGAATSSR